MTVKLLSTPFTDEWHQMAAVGQRAECDDLGGAGAKRVRDAVEHEQCVDVVTVVGHRDVDVAVAVHARLGVAERRVEIAVTVKFWREVLAICCHRHAVGTIAEATEGAGRAGAGGDGHVLDRAGARVGDMEDDGLGALVGECDRDRPSWAVSHATVLDTLGNGWSQSTVKALREVGRSHLDDDCVVAVRESAEGASCGAVRH